MGGGAWSVEEIDEVANILFVGHRLCGFWGERDERFEEVGEVGEEANPGIGVEGLAANNRLESEARMVWGGALAESGDVLRELIEGVKFFGENLTEIGFGGLGDVDDHRIGGEIAEALGVTGEEEREAADEVEPGEKIDGAEKISDEDLVDLEAKTVGIHDAEAGDFFSEGLTAPDPFGGDAVSDGDDKKC